MRLLREDQTDVDSALIDSRIESICREESLTPLPAPEGESYRFRAIRFPNSETLLLLTISHGVADGLGFARFIDEVGCAYRAWVAGLEPELPDVTVQALDFSGWLDTWRGENRERLTAYLRK